MAETRSFLFCSNRSANPHLGDWSMPVRVERTTSAHIFIDKRSNQKLKKGSDLPKVTQLKMWQNQLPNPWSRVFFFFFLTSASSLWTYFQFRHRWTLLSSVNLCI